MKKIFLFSLFIVFIGCASVPREGMHQNPIYYPPLPQEPRLQFLHSITDAHDLGKKQSALQEFILGKPDNEKLGRPYDVGSSKGKIYVLDRVYRKIVVLDLADQTLSFIDDSGMGSLGNPSGIWISDDDLKYVADMQRKQVVVFNRNNEFLRAYGNAEIFEKPVDVAVHGNRVYVIDIDKEQLFILDKDTGGLIRAVGKKGDFFKPSHLTVGPGGEVFVNDAFNFRVKVLSPDGDLRRTIGFHGDQIGGFARPKGLAVDKANNLYAVDAAFENVQIFDDQSRLLLFFGGSGSAPGSLYLPAGIAIDYANVGYFSKFASPNFKIEYLVYVTSMFGSSKLNVYGFGKWVGDTLPENQSIGR